MGAERTKIDGRRHYKIDGNAYPSVTEVTNFYPPKKEAIASWKKSTEDWKYKRNRAGIVGDLAHYRILNEYAIRELPTPEVDMGEWAAELDQIEEDVETCELLWDQCNLPVSDSPLIEKKCWSHEHGYAGTFDMYSDGTVVDLKTSVAVQDSYRMQIAAYFFAMREMPDMPDPEDAAIVVICPYPEKNPKMVPKATHIKEPELAEWFETFTECLSRYQQKA